MRPFLFVLTQALCAALVLASMATARPAEISAGSVQSITLEGEINCPYMSIHGGTSSLQICITTPDAAKPQRKPLNLAIVLDRSGSMADEGKIENAKKALYSLIDQLNEEDIISIVIYDDVINVLCGSQKARNKAELRHLVENIFPRGSTNLGGGMVEGFRQVERNVSKEYVNRVILLSDGLANQGVTDPNELNRIARRFRAKSISLTTMGVGLEYNENLMAGLAENGGGNYYFIERPTNLASIVRNEYKMLSQVAAQNAWIELTPGINVHVTDIIGSEYHRENNRYLIPVGDLYFSDHREFTVELEIPEGTQDLTAASGILKYDSDRPIARCPSFCTTIHYTHDAAEIEKNRDWKTQGRTDAALSTRRVEHAMESLDKGNNEEASKELNDAAMMLGASPAANQSGAGGEAVRAQLQKIESYKTMLNDSLGNARRAKKAIQYDNYQTQKSK